MTEHCLRILHLTDLHERGPRETEAWRRRRVLGDAWLRNLDEIGTVDLVCFTGDLADRGQAQEYERAAEFLDGTLQRLGLARERLYLVPGNHDIDRGIGKPAWQKLREHLHHASPQAVSRWLAGGPAPFGFADDEREAVLARRDAWHGFLRDFGLPHLLPGSGPHLRLGWRQTLSLPYPVHLLGLDTAWLAGDDHDAGALRLTEDQVMRLATDADGKPLAGLRIALLHHPLDDLADGAYCRRLLGEHVDVVLRGHLHETEPTLWADPERRLAQLASGCLYEGHGGDAYPNACAVLELHVDAAGRPQRAHLRLRGWSSRGHWFDDNSLYRDTRDGRLVWWGGAASPPPPLHPRVADVFAGRTEELRQLAAALLPASGAPRPVAVCAVQGMAGVGKSYLVDRFYDRHRAGFPGGYVRLVLDPLTAEADLTGRLLAQLDLPGGGDPAVVLRAALQAGPALLHVENVDGEAMAD
nr:metallophosphoesterase [Plasticicumulans sp.]